MTTFLANLYLRAITVRDREEGQAMAEYGIILALIAVLVIAAVALLGHQILDAFNTITTKLANP
jgi:pilus assembly protein Flp/PilA